MAGEHGAGDTTDTAQLSEHAQGLLKMTRDTEFLQSFLRVDLGNDSDPEETKAHNQRTAAMSRRAAADKAAEEAASASPSAGVATSSGGGGQRRASVHEKHRDGDTTPRAPHKTTFSQLTRDMKLKKNPRRKRGKERRQEEFYTDRDRAATVNMGSRDLKRDIKEKQRLDRSRTLQIPDEADPGTLLALGNHEMRGGDVSVAINFVHKALELNPSDKNALVARSKCYLLMGEPQKALQDAETALQDDKTFIRAIYQKAESLYHLGDFEHSLMFYHRGHRIRPELEGFRLGVQKAQEAIENIIGGKTLKQGPKKPTSGPKIVRVDTSESGGSVSIAGSEDMSSECGKPKTRAGSSRRRSSQHLLGELSVDKVYLEQLLNHPDLKCPHQESAKHITSFAEEGVAFLNNRQEFWRQQRSTKITSKKAKS